MKLISIRKMKKRINVPANVKMGRIRAIWLFCIALQAVSIPILAQSAKITLRLKNVTVEEVLTSIENQTEYRFLYNKDIVDVSRIVSISVKNELMTLVLDKLFKGEGVSYTIEKRQIVLNKVSSQRQDNKQPVKVTGKVVDEFGETLPGVTVMIEGMTQGTITGIDGNYQLQVPEGSTLKFTSIGYTTYTQKITRPMTLNVTMKEDSKQLDEVVVVGYGTQKKINLTGAVSTINVEKELDSRPLTNLSMALSGMSAGVQTLQLSGKPNSDMATIRIRGVGTLNNSNPLVLVDGMELSFNDINPNDVASISILKDAASCAIYGNRGANGVIMITTKEGKKGKTSVNYSGKFSLNQPSNLIQLVSNSADYFELMNESARNIGQSDIFSQNTINEWREAEKNPNGLAESGYPNYVAYPNTDWYKELFQNKIMSEHTISVVGASDNVNYNFSGSFLDNPGLIQDTGLRKYYIRSNITVKVKDWLQIGNRSHGYHTDQDRNEVDAFTGGIHGQKLPPDIYPEYDGKLGLPEAVEEDPTSSNPLHLLASSGGSFKYEQLNTSMFADATILKDFVYHVEFDYMRYRHDADWLSKQIGRYSFRRGKLVEQPTTLENMSKAVYSEESKRWRFVQTLDWTRSFGKHDLGALVGYEAIRNWGFNTDMAKQGAADASLTDLSTYTELSNITGTTWENTSRSFFGRLTYAYKSRYLFEVNARYDDSSRFAPESRWGFFPSFSGGWRVSEESFMQGSPFDNLKIRLSWGKLGNNSIGDYEWQATYSGSNYIFGDKLTSGLAQTVIANQKLRWESVTQTNIGLDFAILNNRLVGEFDIYNKVTDGILYRPGVYATMGNKTPARQNYAEVTNKGVEFTLNWNDRVNEWSYSFSGNFSYNKNLVSKFKGALKKGWEYDENGSYIYKSNLGDVSDGGDNRIIEGHIINEYYLKEPYKGDATYFFNNGLVNPTGGPKDGMIRTEQDMQWLKAMQDQGYVFYPNQKIGKANLWYGDYIYADINGDGLYGNDYDKKFQKVSSVPKYYYGLQGAVTWKGFDVSMNWQGAAGFSIYWYSVGQNSTSTILGYGLSKELQKDHYFYDPENPNDPRTNLYSKNSRLTLNQTNQATEASTLHLEKGNFLKLRNLTIGYTLPQAWTQKFYANKVRIYFSGENLLTITKFSGMDPEMQTGMGYVTMRQLALGININF